MNRITSFTSVVFSRRILTALCITAAALTVVMNGTGPYAQALEEVDKGKIPENFLAASLKALSNGITIWDAGEALKQLETGTPSILYIDTRPADLFRDGSIRGALLMTYHKNETFPPAEQATKLTKEKLMAALQKTGAQKVAFFCQGPKCHRSYNAALRAVQKWGLPSSRVIWFRGGYPEVLKKVLSDPMLKMKKHRYRQGTILSR